MLTTLLNYVLLFFLFSMLGWTIETTYRSLGERKIINTGFLYGPLCPIYGTGALVFQVLLTPLSDKWWLVLLLGTLAADIVEYMTSVIMEKLFHARWWDYTDEFMNLNGRICLKHTCYWAVFSVIYVYFVAPMYEYLISFIPQNVRYVMLGVILTVFTVDLILTVRAALDIQKILRKTEEIKSSINNVLDAVKTTAENLRDDAGLRMDDLQTAISDSTEKLATWRKDTAATVGELKNRYEELRSKQKSGNYGSRAKRLFTSSGSISQKADHLMKDIEAKIEELKARFDN